MTAGTQFQISTSEITNLDRCNLCGAVRAAHGIDWTCSTGTPGRPRRMPMIAVIAVAGLVAIAGVVILTVTSTTSTSLGSIGAAACLGGLTVLICGAEIAYRHASGYRP